MPQYVYVDDAHIDSEPQDIALALLTALRQHPQYRPGSIGFYVEALYPGVNPVTDKLRGGVLNYDRDGKTMYRATILGAVKLKIPVHGIDLEKKD